MDPEHPLHVAAWLAETFGGPRTYTHKLGGYERMVSAHRDRGLTEQRWLSRLVQTADPLLPRDPDGRQAFVAYLEWGSRIAVLNSRPGTAIMEHGPAPRWGWGESPPFVPQPWDALDAAHRGRERWASEQ